MGKFSDIAKLFNSRIISGPTREAPKLAEEFNQMVKARKIPQSLTLSGEDAAAAIQKELNGLENNTLPDLMDQQGRGKYGLKPSEVDSIYKKKFDALSEKANKLTQDPSLDLLEKLKQSGILKDSDVQQLQEELLRRGR